MKKKTLFLFFFLLVMIARADFVSVNCRFTVDQIRGCAPFTVNITDTNNNGTTGECTTGRPCLMKFDNSTNCPPHSSCTNVFQFTYTKPGRYWLNVLYQSTGKDSIFITVDKNILPAFNAVTCGGNNVKLTITDTIYTTYAVAFNNDAFDFLVDRGNGPITHQYPSSGSHTIKVKGALRNPPNTNTRCSQINSPISEYCSTNIQTFTALSTLPTPTINTLTATDPATLQLAFTNQPNIEYTVDRATNNSTTFQNPQTLFNVNSLTVPKLNLNTNYYCLRLGTTDPCANTTTYVAPICSQALTGHVSEGIDLSWQTSSLGVSDIQINKDNTLLTSVRPTTTSYSDKDVVCKKRYCYQLVSHYSGGAASTSLSVCETAVVVDVPTAVNNISSVINTDATKVNLSWLQDPAFTATSYTVFRSSHSNAFVSQGTTPTPQYTDIKFMDGNCYKINYTDACGNASAPGLSACPIWLNTTTDAIDVVLKWNAYKGWVKGVKEYTVEKFNQQGQLIQTLSIADSTYVDSQQDFVNQVAFYKITAHPNDASVPVSISNRIKIVKKVFVYYPTAFNPDSKVAAVNKTFAVNGHFISSAEMAVYDRWGALVFYTDKNEAWDGKREGTNMPDDIYVWKIKGTDFIGNSFEETGTVMLIRK